MTRNITRLAAPLAALVALAAAASPAHAVTCAAGVYRAGCVGPNGAAVAHRPVAAAPPVKCAAGVYRAGCVGPNGGVVTSGGAVATRHTNCYMRGGVRVCN